MTRQSNIPGGGGIVEVGIRQSNIPGVGGVVEDQPVEGPPADSFDVAQMLSPTPRWDNRVRFY